MLLYIKIEHTNTVYKKSSKMQGNIFSNQHSNLTLHKHRAIYLTVNDAIMLHPTLHHTTR